MATFTSTVAFAILAPIPVEHRETGLPVANGTSFVAYGSQKWEILREVDTVG